MIYFDYLQQTFFDDAIHTSIPETVQSINEEQHHEFLMALNHGAKITQDLKIMPRPSLAHIWQPETQQWILDKNEQKKVFQAAQAARLSELNAQAQHFIQHAANLDKIPEFEVQSWALQAIEAKAWAKDKTVATPVLDKIAAARGVPADALKQAALRKTLQYEALTAFIAGQRQALQTRIEAAKTLEDLNAIEITFRLPESE